MNRPRHGEMARAGILPGPAGTALGIAVGLAALVVVGSVLGRGLGPPASADLVAVQGRASGTQNAGDGVVGAFSGALRALGGAQPEAEPASIVVPEVVPAIRWDPIVKVDAAPRPSISIEEAPGAPMVEERPLPESPPPLAVAVAAPEPLAVGPLTPREDVGVTSDVPGPPLVAVAPESGPAPAPPPLRQEPPPAQSPPAALAAPPTVETQPTRRPTRTPVPATRTPQPSATPRASATPHPTAAPRTLTPVRTAAPAAKPQPLIGNV